MTDNMVVCNNCANAYVFGETDSMGNPRFEWAVWSGIRHGMRIVGSLTVGGYAAGREADQCACCLTSVPGGRFYAVRTQPDG